MNFSVQLERREVGGKWETYHCVVFAMSRNAASKKAWDTQTGKQFEVRNVRVFSPFD